MLHRKGAGAPREHVETLMGPPWSRASTGGETRAASHPGPPDVRQHHLPVSRAAPERALRKLEMYNRLAELVAAEPLTETGTLRLHFRVTDDGPFTFLPGQFEAVPFRAVWLG